MNDHFYGLDASIGQPNFWLLVLAPRQAFYRVDYGAGISVRLQCTLVAKQKYLVFPTLTSPASNLHPEFCRALM
jgi:hypothetical protein